MVECSVLQMVAHWDLSKELRLVVSKAGQTVLAMGKLWVQQTGYW